MFTPSKFQQAVYDFIQTGKGNAVISAVAGSGKTTTLLNALKFIPTELRVLFLAFNRSIAGELKDRTGDVKNVDVKTVHGFGMKAIINAFDNVEVFNLKYKYILNDIIEFVKTADVSSIEQYKINDPLSLVDFDFVEHEQYQMIFNNIVKLCDLGRLDLVNLKNVPAGVSHLYELANKHNIIPLANEPELALQLIKVGMSYTQKIDFTDMIFLPNVYNLDVFKYDFVFIDECQDLNACQRELMRKAIKKNGGRFIAVGDPAQAIYGFAGADSESFDKLRALPHTTELPLSVCYRCGSDIIEMAKGIIPQIEAFEGSKKGEVNMEGKLDEIRDGDMVLCRMTYPLVRLCLKFLTEDKKATIMGSDIGKSISKMVENTERKREEWNMENMFNRLYDELEKTMKTIMKKQKLNEEDAKETSTYMMAEEKVMVIEMLAANCKTPQDIINKIDAIFSDKKKEGIILSTVHKSKGLEADRVFIVHPDKLPHPMAKLAWEQIQEKNLQYVAYTRAKSYLAIIQTDEFDAWAGAEDEKQEDNVTEVIEPKWVGQIGEKVDLKVEVITAKPITTSYGETMLYEMKDKEGNMFTKFGVIRDSYIVSQHSEIEEGTLLEFSGTIKKHHEFKGEKINVLSHLSRI